MSKEAMKLALEALKQIDEAMPFPVAKLAQAALREALAEQPAQQEPVAWRAWFDADHGARWLFSLWPEEERLDVEWQPLYTSPPAQRTWVGLTDEDVMSIAFNFDVSSLSLVAKAIEAKLKEKNT